MVGRCFLNIYSSRKLVIDLLGSSAIGWAALSIYETVTPGVRMISLWTNQVFCFLWKNFLTNESSDFLPAAYLFSHRLFEKFFCYTSVDKLVWAVCSGFPASAKRLRNQEQNKNHSSSMSQGLGTGLDMRWLNKNWKITLIVGRLAWNRKDKYWSFWKKLFCVNTCEKCAKIAISTRRVWAVSGYFKVNRKRETEQV